MHHQPKNIFLNLKTFSSTWNNRNYNYLACKPIRDLTGITITWVCRTCRQTAYKALELTKRYVSEERPPKFLWVVGASSLHFGPEHLADFSEKQEMGRSAYTVLAKLSNWLLCVSFVTYCQQLRHGQFLSQILACHSWSKLYMEAHLLLWSRVEICHKKSCLIVINGTRHLFSYSAGEIVSILSARWRQNINEPGLNPPAAKDRLQEGLGLLSLVYICFRRIPLGWQIPFRNQQTDNCWALNLVKTDLNQSSTLLPGSSAGSANQRFWWMLHCLNPCPTFDYTCSLPDPWQ